jgi:RNA polymerase sigma-70 factor (ECF subfamily)
MAKKVSSPSANDPRAKALLPGEAISATAAGTSNDRDETFRHLYRYARRVVTFFVRRYGVSIDEAQDLTQETFVRLFRNLDSYRGEGEWAYLERVAHHVAMNVHRSRAAVKRSAVQVTIDAAHDLVSDPADPASAYVEQDFARARMRRLATAIDELPNGARQAIVLYLEDLSYDEIAQALGVTTDAVKSRIKDARRILKIAMAADETS